MAISSFVEILEDQNPWWRSAARRALSYPRRRELQRQVVARIKRLDDRRALVIRGPRQVGKTVLLLQVADDLLAEGWPPANLAYFDFSDDRLQAAVSPRQVAEAHPAGFDPDLPHALLLDEISRAPHWDRWLKQAVDANDGARIAATDSGAALLQAAGEESGQGRWDEVICETYSLRDFAALHAIGDEDVGVILGRDPALTERYLAVGGFPEHAHNLDLPEVRRRLRRDIADRAIRRDLTRAGVEVEQVARLFAYLMESSGAIFTAHSRARDLQADPRSIRKWLDSLLATLLVFRLEPFHSRAAARLRSAPKIFAADPGLVAAFSAAAEDNRLRGLLFEAAVYRHLREAAHELEGELSYFRAPDGLEIDFVLSMPGAIIAIEVTSSTRARSEKLRRARQAADRLGADRLLLVHGGVVAEPAEPVRQVSLTRFLADPTGAVRSEEVG